MYWPSSTFATLTYDDAHLPKDGGLSMSDVQLAIKRVRKSLGKRRIRYYGCGEYGERFGRPHYHVIFFGLDQIRDRGKIVDAWSLSDPRQVYLSGVGYDSGRYVADYIGKQLSGDLAEEVYGGRQPPFRISSHGLGRQWCLDHRAELVADPRIRVRGHWTGVPRYYFHVLGLEPDYTLEGQAESIDRAVARSMRLLGEFDGGKAIADDRRGVVVDGIRREEEQRERNLAGRLSVRRARGASHF